MAMGQDTVEKLVSEELCPRYQRAIEILGKRWTGLIIRVLLPGPRRFGEVIHAVPGLSDRLLSDRLRELEGCGIVERCVYPETPVRIEYCLTDKGRELEDVVGAIQKWADCWETEAASNGQPATTNGRLATSNQEPPSRTSD